MRKYRSGFTRPILTKKMYSMYNTGVRGHETLEFFSPLCHVKVSKYLYDCWSVKSWSGLWSEKIKKGRDKICICQHERHPSAPPSEIRTYFHPEADKQVRS